LGYGGTQHLQAIWHGGNTLSHKPLYLKWLRCLPQDLQQALRELSKPLQQAIHEAVTSRNPFYRPRLYANDWLEELYHEAIAAALEAHQRYDPNRGCSLYRWGLQVIGRRLQAFCDRVWDAARHECDYPCDEEKGEEVEFPDERASEAMEEGLLACEVREALHELGGLDEQIGLWYLFDELSEREIAERSGISQPAVCKRLKRILGYVRRHVGVEGLVDEGKRGRKRGERGEGGYIFWQSRLH
jgi:RNA polymerase sigma factor (sigma-70 family)